MSAALSLAALLAIPVAVQDHAHHAMPAPQTVTPAPATPQVVPAERLGTDLPPGNDPAPAPPQPHYGDRYWDAAEMARGRDIMMRRDGGARTFAQVMVDIAEVAVRDGSDGYRWQGEAWFGGDIDRFVAKSEGEGTTGRALDAGEVQALYSRAIGPYFNIQGGVRHDFRPRPARTHAVLGVEGLAPYWFEIDAAMFLSTKGEVTARIEGYYDQRITQRLILQPRVEVSLSAQDARDLRLGSGLTGAEAGVRLRYEIARQFAPYLGVSWERKYGDTARLVRASGDDTGGVALVLGIRAWF